MSNPYYDWKELIIQLDSNHLEFCLNIYEKNQEIFDNAKGSKVKHQAWQGGYISHINEIFNIAFRMYNDLNSCRNLPFKLSDALFILFIHDLEKPWKYGGCEKSLNYYQTFKDEKEFILTQLGNHNIILNEEQYNALKYVHGEGDDYDPYKNVQLPLAAFVHCCDVMSARIWPNESKSNSW